MNVLEIKEVKSDQSEIYKSFFTEGLIKDEENFRISPNDEKNASFPTSDKPDNFTLGAYINSDLAGVVSFIRDGGNREKFLHKGTLIRVYVSQKYRGQGISKKLIIELIERVKLIASIEQIYLTVISANSTAKKIYENLGFVLYGTEPNAIKWKDKYFSEDLMVLFLK